MGLRLCSDSFTQSMEMSDPMTMMKKGLKNCVCPAVISKMPKTLRSTLRSANRVSDEPACSKSAQKRMLKRQRMMKMIILSRRMRPPRIPSRMRVYPT